MKTRYLKDTARIMVKFVQESSNSIVLEVPTTAMEIHDFLKADYITSIIKNTFGEKADSIGDIIVIIDQRYVAKS